VRVLLTIIFLQVLHVDGIDADRKLGIVYVLAEHWEAVSLVCWVFMMFGIDDFLCIVEIVTTTIAAS